MIIDNSTAVQCTQWYLILSCARFKFNVMNIVFASTKLLTTAGFFKAFFRDPIRVPRILNSVPRIRENYHRVHKI